MNNFGKKNNKFSIDDQVVIKGYEGRIFKVLEYVHSLTYKDGKLLDEHTYKVKDISNGEIITGCPEDMSKYINRVSMKKFEENHKYIIDKSLDKYNDTMSLYKNFGDQKYKDEADDILRLLKEYSDEYKGKA